ncbi:uncharacterized protein ACR2FA_000686 [Aphomia sociella]
MGGCRCTYGTCTVRSDGKTHMFHYPVFDKVRCHQWLLNANRPEFLNLKVSQLKNRVVCQHHFKDEHFMNYKKEKLTFEAIPTEDGPYCDKSQNKGNDGQQVPKIDKIVVDDIENEYLSKSDKKAIVSVKYADFLMNNDLSDLSFLMQNDKSSISSRSKTIEDYPDINIHNIKIQGIQEPKYINTRYSATDKSNSNIIHSADPKLNSANNSVLCYNQTTPDTSKKNQTPPVLIVSPFCNATDEKLIKVELPSNFDNSLYKQLNKNNNATVSNEKQINGDKKKSKIRIISEKRISEPITIPDNWDPIRASIKYNLIDGNPEPHIEVGSKEGRRSDKNMILQKVVDDINIEETPKKSNEKDIQNLQILTSPNMSLLKNKISPERIAAIEKKRKFNMKLRDIIESCLDNNIDDSDKVLREIKCPKSLKNQAKQNEVYKVKPYQDKKPDMSNIQEYTIANLDNRIKRMEETLLRKIEQNSNMITELKSSVTSKTKSTSTQIPINEESHKRRLYHEISKYLSPDANNIIYEELFINKYAHKEPKSPPSKRYKFR